MERSQLMRGVLDVAVLAVIDARDGYGYDIQRRLIDAGLDGLGEATIYGTLRRLYKSGALTTYSVPSDEGPNRRYYGITDAGREELVAGRSAWSNFSSAVAALLAHPPLSVAPDPAPTPDPATTSIASAT